MTNNFIRQDHIEHLRLNNNSKVYTIFQKVGWLKFFNKFSGYNEKVALEFSKKVELMNKKGNSKHGSNELDFYTQVRGLKFLVNEDLISKITEITKGHPWDKDDRIFN